MKLRIFIVIVFLCAFTDISSPGRPATSGPNEPFGVFVNNNTNSIQFINPQTQVASDEYLKGQLGSYGGGLFDVVITPNGKTAIVSNFGDSKIFFIDISGGRTAVPTVLGSTPVSLYAIDLAITPDGKYVLVTDGGFSSACSVVNVQTRQLVKTYDLGSDNAQAVAISPDGKTVITVAYTCGKCHLYRLNPVTGALTYLKSIYFNDPSTWPSGVKKPADWTTWFELAPLNVAISPDGQTAIVVDGHNNQAAILTYDTISGTFQLRQFIAPDPAEPRLINMPNKYGQSCVFNKKGDKAYYLSNSQSRGTLVHVLDITGPGKVTPSGTSIGISPMRGTSMLFGVDTIALDPDGSHLYVANPTVSGGVTEISVIDLTTNGQVGYIPANGIPTGIAFTTPEEDTGERISSSRTSLNYGASTGGHRGGASAGPAAGFQTASQQVVISNAGIGTLTWQASSSASWLWCSPPSGTGTANLTVSIDPAGLAPGTYTGRITITSNAPNSPQVITVTLTVYGAGLSAVPFGEFATPVEGSLVCSSIPVTGWVLDDLGVNAGGLKIYRDPVAGDPDGAIGPNGLVYVGDGLFVEGARPDVEESYPSFPLNYRAGWGYMLLTNFLPNQGNGTFKLHAIATDAEGNAVTLGTKTITCDNVHAVKPFGAIDTPAQGGAAEGKSFINFGWALTPLPNMIPKDGSTLDVYVDGVNLGHPTYDQFRSDVAALFPGYKNSDGAVGFRYIDTTAYANGVHTIHWIAADDAGNVDGIGSRYFTINNTALKTPTASMPSPFFLMKVLAGSGGSSALLELGDVLALPVSFSPLSVKRGFHKAAPAEIFEPGKDGSYRIDIKEVELLTISLNPDRAEGDPPPSPPFRKGGDESKSLRENAGNEPEAIGKKGGDGNEYAGSMVVAGELRPLPIGSTLDALSGMFSWMPGPGFLGSYNLVFVVKDAFGMARRIPVRVRISPKF